MLREAPERRPERSARALDRIQVALRQPPASTTGVESVDHLAAERLDLVEQARRRPLAALSRPALDVAGEPAQTAERDPPAEPARGGLLEPVGLVEDDRVVLGKDASFAATPGSKREVREVEGVIRDHELRAGGPLARGLGEARSAKRTAAAEAAIGPDRELRPQGGRRLEGELRTISGVRRVDPAEQLTVLCGVLRRPEQRPGLGPEQREPLEAAATKVVVAPLQKRAGDVAREGRGSGRDVVCEQLLLQSLRRRRDDDPQAALDRRDQVREALAGPRARLREQMPAAGERVLDRLRERLLLRARLKPGETGRQSPARPEHRLHLPGG